jgi:23S rRNA pseudouridine2605 synthase
MRAARARSGARRPAGRSSRHRSPATTHTGEPERLQKMLARLGLASRREAESWIRAGRLTVNGSVATLGARVRPTDQVRLDGRTVHARLASGPAHVYACHRSPGEPLAAYPDAKPVDAARPRAALVGRLPRRAGRRFIAVSPMPRVDGGLELVTSDGELAARLQRGVHALAGAFSVRVRGELTEAQLQGVLEGALDSGAHLAIERCEAAGGEGANRWYTLVARGTSGKQVRQLFERQGALVSRVLRTQFGPLLLERTLARGRFRELTQEELRALLADAAAEAGEA